MCTVFTDFILFLIFVETQIAISLEFYMELLHVLERLGGFLFYVFAGVEIITILCCCLYAKMSSWAFWGGRLVASCSWLLSGLVFIVLAGVQIMTISSYSLYAEMLQN